jgi:phage recombination protein Bet
MAAKTATKQTQQQTNAAPPPTMEIDRFTPGKSHGLIAHMAAKYGIDSDKMLDTLKQTAFRQRGKNGAPPVSVSNEQMMMLLVIAREYNLNPFTREIYAYPSDGGIVPIVSVDGWVRIVNERPELEYIDVVIAEPGTEDPWAACEIKRKDRTKPLKITEFLAECYRDTDPWNQMPRRMIRHKAFIQCARVAFGFAGIFDPDEADRIIATIEAGTLTPRTKPRTEAPKELSPDTGGAISAAQVTQLKDKLHAEGIPENLLLANFELDTLENLPAASFDKAVEWVNSATGTVA